MATIHPEPNALEALCQVVPPDQPIVLINLLRYKAWTDLSEGRLSGRECYARYANAMLPVLARAGARRVWRGQVKHVLIGPQGDRWDEAILVAYPSRSAFERLVTDPDLEANAHLRTAALEDSRLIVATAPQSFGRVTWFLVRLTSRLRHLKGRVARTGNAK